MLERFVQVKTLTEASRDANCSLPSGEIDLSLFTELIYMFLNLYEHVNIFTSNIFLES